MRWRLFKPNIEKLKSKGDINRLIMALEDRNSELREKAASALGEMGPKSVLNL
ncbi:MAG TPA: hypothetical protein VMW67_04050 [Desulfobacteria bacterium]|nr:hypothetical protein [Desulfobacteria bacterium]